MHTEVMRTIVTLLLATLCGPAIADDRSFQVTVRVMPRHPAMQALAALPMPPGTMPLTASSFGSSYYYAGELRAAADFYRLEMPKLGYQLVRASSDGSDLTWHDANTRVELRLRQVLGIRPATRIVVFASDRR